MKKYLFFAVFFNFLQGFFSINENNHTKIEHKSQEFQYIWPYLLIICLTMGGFFAIIVYNIKSTEKILIKSIKEQ